MFHVCKLVGYGMPGSLASGARLQCIKFKPGLKQLYYKYNLGTLARQIMRVSIVGWYYYIIFVWITKMFIVIFILNLKVYFFFLVPFKI